MEYLLHTQSSVDMVEIQMSVEGRYRFLWEGVILVGYLLQIHISVFMLILTSYFIPGPLVLFSYLFVYWNSLFVLNSQSLFLC